jgi:hypothetical protein
MDTKQIQATAAEIYSVRSDELGFCEAGWPCISGHDLNRSKRSA